MTHKRYSLILLPEHLDHNSVRHVTRIAFYNFKRYTNERIVHLFIIILQDINNSMEEQSIVQVGLENLAVYNQCLPVNIHQFIL